ncbi:dihydroxyacetone kinase subunit DhaL [Schleiferilactobacillus harbinensis]|jgi:dihydroxyacetone kinase-like protein|uniref:dihydroxyacetone kinase subunit DhaL n=1 Tax=Schleiferilactobacillus harbinensis TaxID=304207 RepID=UPI0007BAD905|nr:dihydroxyacetone kinase subunit DhaL [Schleiferilactobacillus harbinensis]
MNVEQVKQWMQLYQTEIEKNKDYLSQLDTDIGDGDHGNNMARGVDAVAAGLAKDNPTDLAQTFKSIAMSLISKVGGASGPLYGTAFLEMAKAAKDSESDIPTLLQAAAEGVAKRGGAKVGDKTMVDVWTPAAQDAKAGQLNAANIDKLVEATKPLRALKGRASYLGERSIGHLDPGAVSTGMLLKTLLRATAK